MFTVKTSAKETAIAASSASETRYADVRLKSILVSCGRREAQKRPNVLDRLVRREETDPVYPHSLGAGDVLRHIVDEDGLTGRHIQSVESELVHSRIGLDQAHLGGDDNVVEGIRHVPLVLEEVAGILPGIGDDPGAA